MTEELAKAFDEIDEAGSLAIKPADYPELFHAAIADRKVRRPEADVRVRIYGPLEARLQSVDRLVLGGLVEGVWPPETRADPWLSRPMRHQLGLDLPERRIGLSAHDFAQALGAPEVILTPRRKTGRRADGGVAFRAAARRGRGRAALGGRAQARRTLCRRSPAGSTSRQAKTGPHRARSRGRRSRRGREQLSVTEIEHWLRDPYTIYAKHVLELAPLDAIDTPPGAADRGTVIHDAIGEFAKTYPDKLPDDAVRELMTEIGDAPLRAARRLSRGARVLVAALFARSPNGSRDFETNAAR